MFTYIILTGIPEVKCYRAINYILRKFITNHQFHINTQSDFWLLRA